MTLKIEIQVGYISVKFISQKYVEPEPEYVLLIAQLG